MEFKRGLADLYITEEERRFLHLYFSNRKKSPVFLIKMFLSKVLPLKNNC